jgi:phosphopantothenoylcysteine decarboxylase / phosphopantothenate---cysteine ligase
VRILITAGPTREYFDTVRFISNPSSGKMGFAIAQEARHRGHDVILVAGPVSLADPPGVRTVHVTSAAEMLEACCDVFESCDAAIMTAAVCDYKPSRRIHHKLQKRATPRAITLSPTRDIAAHLGSIKGGRVLIGFAMEDHDHHAHAEQKLRRKNCDAIVLNGKENVGTDDATVEILHAGQPWEKPFSASKSCIATRVVSIVEEISEASGATSV